MGRSPGSKLTIRREYVKSIRNTNPMSGNDPIETELTEEAKIIFRKSLF